MINITYKIEFFNEWHCGSGLSAGADVDALVIKDKNKLPYIPGKTIKGLVRQAIEEIIDYKGNNKLKEEVKITFGEARESSEDGQNENEFQQRGTVFFTNATLSPELQFEIKEANIQDYLFRTITSTAINENGVAKKNSLRKMQTTIPCVLYGEILGVRASLTDEIKNALIYIKRLGVSRNRGLGRCRFYVIKVEEII